MLNVCQMDRGPKVTPSELTGITATTTSIKRESKGHNAMILYFNFTAGSGTFSIKLQGRSPDGAYIDLYDINNTLMGMSSVTADRARFIVGIPDDFKIVATEDVNGATVTISYELFSV